MKKSFKTKILSGVLSAVICSLTMPSLAANPGTEEDPLISMSYVDEVLIPQLKSYVDTKASELSGNAYQLVDVKKGQTIIGSQSTEFILRAGTATVVATKKGGLADVTAGIDLPNGSEMPSNHLLIIPFDDWRGVTMTSDGILMIKGAYTIV